MNAQPKDAEELESLLKRTMQALIERTPDGYGRILRALHFISKDPVIDELIEIAYREDREQALAEELASSKPAPGIH